MKAQNCLCSTNGRNLVVCIDGTSNKFGKAVRLCNPFACIIFTVSSSQNTNVIELYRQVVKSDNQLTYYNSGVGTYPKPSRKSLSNMIKAFDNAVDLVVAWYVHDNLRSLNLTNISVGTLRQSSSMLTVGFRRTTRTRTGYFFSVGCF